MGAPKQTFGTAINCIDGRVQECVTAWVRKRFGVDFVDMITEAGPDRIMALGPVGKIISIKEQVAISVKGHGSKAVVIAGHYDCAANPVPEEDHIDEIRQAVERIRDWEMGVRVAGLWVNENWKVKVVCEAS